MIRVVFNCSSLLQSAPVSRDISQAVKRISVINYFQITLGHRGVGVGLENCNFPLLFALRMSLSRGGGSKKAKIPLLKDGPLCKAEQIRKMTIKIVPDEQRVIGCI